MEKTMQPTTKVLERIQENSKENPNEVFTRLYRYMLRPDMYYLAYRNLYANNGAATKGVNDDTADGFSESYVGQIICRLSNESYQPSPARRTYIPKNNGKKRPLGIPTFTDKLVQEVLRMILEAVYEPTFLNSSHGFRPKRSCHTALKDVKHAFHGARWFVEGDIKGCFDNIDHHKLVAIIQKKIKDARLCKLIFKFLKAGYMEDWRHHNTYSGTPQGGIVSPILANIYLHELDVFVDKLRENFARPQKRQTSVSYCKMKSVLRRLSKQIESADQQHRQLLLKEYKAARLEMMKLPYKSQTDKRLTYVRYADDFLIGVVGGQEDCIQIKALLKDFIASELSMELSEEKTLITHSSQKARFLGYDIRVRRSNIIKGTGHGYAKRTLNNMTELTVPMEKIERFLFHHAVVVNKNGKLKPIHRGELLRLSDMEIVHSYNWEIRGICNYYHMASNYWKLRYFGYLMEYSCLKTLACKHKSSVRKVIRKFHDGNGDWGVPYENRRGKQRLNLVKPSDCRENADSSDLIPLFRLMHKKSTTTFEARLKAKVCELCGDTQSKQFEIHHIHKVKDLKGRTDWERMMIAKRRKTLVVCHKCHMEIHHGQKPKGV